MLRVIKTSLSKYILGGGTKLRPRARKSSDLEPPLLSTAYVTREEGGRRREEGGGRREGVEGAEGGRETRPREEGLPNVLES